MTHRPTPPSPGPTAAACRLRGGRWRLAALAPLALGLALLMAHGRPRAQPQDDGALKAAIVFNLLMFVQWPGESSLPEGSPLRLCTDRRGTLWPHLAALQDRPLRRWRLDLRELADNDPLRDCQIVLLDAGVARRRATPRPAQALLTVGNDERADDAGVVLDLHRAGGRVVFDVDLAAARRGGLQISSKLLRLARTVRE